MDVSDIKKNVVCCACEHSLLDSKQLNFVQLPYKAGWNYPVWGNLIAGTSGLAMAFVCDNCYCMRSLVDSVKFAIEIDGEVVKYHPVPE